MKRELFLIFLGFCLGAFLVLAMWQAHERWLIDKYERMLNTQTQDISEEC